MKSFSVVLGIVLFILCVGGCAQTEPKSATRVSVLTYNIYHGEDANGGSNLDAVAGIINKLQPDLVALQEVDKKTTRVEGLDLTAELMKRTGMQGIFGRAMDYAGGGYGEAVLVLGHHRIVDVRNNLLPHSSGAEPRAALEVHVELLSGERVVFVGTHLDHVRDQTDRMKQAGRIVELYEDVDLPVILAGDLNAVPNSDPIKLLRRQWTCADPIDPQPTFPSAAPKRKIDYILFKPKHRWNVLTTRVIDDKVTSDHCPMYAVLELLPES